MIFYIRQIIASLLFVFLFLSACSANVQDNYQIDIPESSKQSIEEENPNGSISSPLTITSLPSGLPNVFQESFNKHIYVFGVSLFATENVPDSKLLHAASVMAEYLDNDQNGRADNSLVIQAMRANQAAMVIFVNEAEESRSPLFEDDFPEDRILQNLYAEEIYTIQPGMGEFDASLEEVLHLVTYAGYSFAFPEEFGEQPGSLLANAMDQARGGRFESIPAEYPEDAWYRYDDHTCKYDCQIAEYIYWALTSLLGAQIGADRCDEICHEWLLNTPEKLRSGDPDIVSLLTNPEYGLPTILPTGNYSPKEN